MTVTETPTHAGTGVHLDMPEDEYHRHPALSSTGARRIVNASPAHFAYDRKRGEATTRTFDLGKAAHLYALGKGGRIVVLDYPDYRTKDAREARDDAHAVGAIPLLAKEDAEARARADALRRLPLWDALIGASETEVSLIWDEPWGEDTVQCRARLDALTSLTVGGGRLVVDYKKCADASLDAVRKAIGRYGYHQQADWYTRGVKALGLAERVTFLFVFQEAAEPYVATPVVLKRDALALAEDLNDRALDLFVKCSKSGEWPGYVTDIATVDVPAWNYYAEEDDK